MTPQPQIFIPVLMPDSAVVVVSVTVTVSVTPSMTAAMTLGKSVFIQVRDFD